MAQIVDFTPGFPILRGKISGKQQLEYPDHNNSAFYSPLNSKNYARNYRPAIIVNKRAATNEYYYNVKTKTAVSMSTSARYLMAMLGGTSSLFCAYGSNTQRKRAMVEIWEEYKQSDTFRGYSYRRFWFYQIRDMLAQKLPYLWIMQTSSIVIYNPWVFVGEPPYTLPDVNYVKFWLQLAKNPITFTVNGDLGVAHVGDTWDNILEGMYNNLGLDTYQGTRKTYVTRQGGYIVDSAGVYVDAIDAVQNGGSYKLVSEPGE